MIRKTDSPYNARPYVHLVLFLAVAVLAGLPASLQAQPPQDDDPRAGVFRADFPWESRYLTIS